VDKAIELADRDGLGGLSMRRLADELGITAMSLYGYVPSKAELLDVMADRAYSQIAASHGEAAAAWQDRLALLARQHWALLLSHPWLLHIAASRPLLGPSVTALYDAELAAVDGLGRGSRRPGPHRPDRPAMVGSLRPATGRGARPGPLPDRGPRRHRRRPGIRRRPRPGPLIHVRAPAHHRRHRCPHQPSLPVIQAPRPARRKSRRQAVSPARAGSRP
jgi:AcrR family transcriptional regulator